MLLPQPLQVRMSRLGSYTLNLHSPPPAVNTIVDSGLYLYIYIDGVTLNTVLLRDVSYTVSCPYSVTRNRQYATASCKLATPTFANASHSCARVCMHDFDRFTVRRATFFSHYHSLFLVYYHIISLLLSFFSFFSSPTSSVGMPRRLSV